MTHEVHLYLAVARCETPGRHPLGELHAVHVYIREDAGTDFKPLEAEMVAASKGWILVELRKAARVSAESVAGAEETVRACYEAAMKDGSAILVYDQPVPGNAMGAT